MTFNTIERRGILLLLLVVFGWNLCAYVHRHAYSNMSAEDRQIVVQVLSADTMPLTKSVDHKVRNQQYRKPQKRRVQNKTRIETNSIKQVLRQSVDINSGSQADWEGLPGIGPYRASRIIKFRDALGGFARIDQVSDTYGLPDSTFLQIKPYLIRKALHEKIDINTSDFKALSMHPYISYKQAKVILAYRAQHGPFTTAQNLLKTKVVSTVELKKMEPYLIFEDSEGKARNDASSSIISGEPSAILVR